MTCCRGKAVFTRCAWDDDIPKSSRTRFSLSGCFDAIDDFRIVDFKFARPLQFRFLDEFEVAISVEYVFDRECFIGLAFGGILFDLASKPTERSNHIGGNRFGKWLDLNPNRVGLSCDIFSIEEGGSFVADQIEAFDSEIPCLLRK